MALKNDSLLRVLAGRHVDRPPVWLMRQAGRILPEYRKIRAEVAGFKSLVSNPDLAAEVTVQPVDILGVDAAILFSDILVIPEAMGLDYELIEKIGPKFPKTITGQSDVDRLLAGKEAAANLEYVYEAIKKTKERLEERVPLLGFAGAPWTLLAYMVEGGGSKTFSKAKAFLYRHEREAKQLLEKITASIIEYLRLKIEAGVDVVQIFDSWAGVLDREAYRSFAIPYLTQICKSIQEVPIIVFSKGAWFSLAEIGQLDSAAIGLDWQTNPSLAREIFGADRVLQGNLDPSIMLSTPELIVQKTTDMLHMFGKHHIANLGHGVYPNTPVENVKCFISTVQSYTY